MCCAHCFMEGVTNVSGSRSILPFRLRPAGASGSTCRAANSIERRNIAPAAFDPLFRPRLSSPERNAEETLGGTSAGHFSASEAGYTPITRPGSLDCPFIQLCTPDGSPAIVAMMTCPHPSHCKNKRVKFELGLMETNPRGANPI